MPSWPAPSSAQVKQPIYYSCIEEWTRLTGRAPDFSDQQFASNIATVALPISVRTPIRARQLWVLNGSAIGAQTYVQMSIMAPGGKDDPLYAGIPAAFVVVSELVHASGPSQAQYFDIPETILSRGTYWVSYGVVGSGITTNKIIRLAPVASAASAESSYGMVFGGLLPPIDIGLGFDPVRVSSGGLLNALNIPIVGVSGVVV